MFVSSRFRDFLGSDPTTAYLSEVAAAAASTPVFIPAPVFKSEFIPTPVYEAEFIPAEPLGSDP